ncbi:hypothetical protein V501_01709, partial [Pseudogymnoascus sp. VKM F-4519 (FW-2642)]
GTGTTSSIDEELAAAWGSMHVTVVFGCWDWVDPRPAHAPAWLSKSNQHGVTHPKLS